MGRLIEFPQRREPPPPTGYCMDCRGAMRWPITGAWPQWCIHCGAAPVRLTSYLPEPGMRVMDGAGNTVAWLPET